MNKSSLKKKLGWGLFIFGMLETIVCACLSWNSSKEITNYLSKNYVMPINLQKERNLYQNLGALGLGVAIGGITLTKSYKNEN